jgi:GGDEF domain-containing protein
MRLMGAGSISARLTLVVAVWMGGAVMLSVLLGPPLPVLVLGMALLTLTYLSYVVTTRGDPNVAPPAASAGVEEDELADESYADHFMAKEFAAAERGRDVTVVVFGFSRFEEFTAERGPGAAAAALREFGRVLQRMTRKMNLTARCGWRSDSFLSVLSGANAAAAQAFIERVRVTAAASDVSLPEIEAGIAVYQAHMASPSELVAEAERALAAARAAAASLAATQGGTMAGEESVAG